MFIFERINILLKMYYLKFALAIEVLHLKVVYGEKLLTPGGGNLLEKFDYLCEI